MSNEADIKQYIIDTMNERVEAGYLLMDLLFTYNAMNKDIEDPLEYFKYYPSDYGLEPPIIYNKILETKPKVIVDVGVLYGLSTRTCLLATRELNKNKNIGPFTHIYSCDVVFPKRGIIDFASKYDLTKYWSLSVCKDLDINFISQFRHSKIDMVLLDSNHEAPHVVSQLNIYSQLMSENGSMFVHDCNDAGVKYAVEYWASRNPEWEGTVHPTKLVYTEFKRKVK